MYSASLSLAPKVPIVGGGKGDMARSMSGKGDVASAC